MPKILINEVDNTTPGTPGNYQNYSVLIAGLMGRTPVTLADEEAALMEDPKSTVVADEIQPDSNGVYEFTSASDFRKTIGLRGPVITTEYDKAATYHYGNQMAYELLKLGYTVIYAPITNDAESSAISKMTDEDFWNIFKDKASYDFRFISHGLLRSSEPSAEYRDVIARLALVTTAANRLDAIKAEAELYIEDQIAAGAIDEGADTSTELSTKCEELYSVIYKNSIKNATGMTADQYAALNDDVKGFVRLDKEASASKYGVAYRTYAEAANSEYSDSVKSVINEKRDLETYKDNYSKQRLVTDGTINLINGNIARLASYISDDAKSGKDTGRGDCIALLELDEMQYTNTTGSATKPEVRIIDAIRDLSSEIGTNGKYCAVTVPSVIYDLSDVSDFDDNKKFPGAFHYLACFMNSIRNGFNEWYAAAGYTRGVSNYAINHTTVTLGEIAINALEPRNRANGSAPMFACNVIANFRGSYYLWGNRTAHSLGDADGNNGDLVASHFLNIRHLCTTIKKQLYVACRRFTFDPNSDTLWFNFVNAIKPTLEAMKADQGIRDYRIIKEFTDKKATLKAKIRIIPIEAVEDFDLEISLEDSFGDTTVNAVESI